MRILKRVPELLDHFISRATSLLSDRNHGVLLCGVTLVTEMCMMDPQATDEFRKVRPVMLNSTVFGGRGSSHRCVSEHRRFRSSSDTSRRS